MKHVIITGAAGFIGSHLCDLLLEKGYWVTGLDNFVTGSGNNIESALGHANFRFVECNVSRPLPISELEFLSRHGLDGILHFACPASPVDFDRLPFEILEVDSIGTIHTVNLALEHDARYVLASTSEVYGDPLIHPQPESYWGNVNSVGPRACYDEAKRFAEAYVSTSMRQLGLNGAIVRIFNTYGPRMRPDDGRMIPEFMMQALRGMPIPITGDGMQTRSLCFISDLVDGVLKVFESGLREAINLGNPDERTVLDTALLVRGIAGSRSEIRNIPPRPEDPRRRCPDITRVRQKTGWEPRVTLEKGLQETLAYFKKNSKSHEGVA